MINIPGFIIGNGESRCDYDLESLRNKGKIYGCNALYRNFKPHTLVSVDRRMVEEILKSKYKEEFVFFNRSEKCLTMSGKPMFNFPYRGWATGPTATWLLCHRMSEQVKSVYLLGFDFGSDKKTINNMYKNTACYRRADAVGPNTKNWVNQFTQIFVEFPNVMFYQVQKKSGDFLIREFIKYKNFEQITYNNFKKVMEG